MDRSDDKGGVRGQTNERNEENATRKNSFKIAACLLVHVIVVV